jgi:two-component system response regulator YesN
VLVESLFSAINLLESLGLNREESLQLLGGQSEPMKYNDSVETAKEYVRKIIKEVIEYRNKISDQKYLGIIEKAKDFIRDNYQNEDMALQLVSSNVNVSSNHFSAIFRKETGITFIDYLTTVRMEKAKDLLTTTSMKTSDVGFEVGYRDPHYFSYIFKKTQGMSPKEFRRQKKEN